MQVCDNCRQPSDSEGGNSGAISVFDVRTAVNGEASSTLKDWCEACALAVLQGDWKELSERAPIPAATAKKKPGPKPGPKKPKPGLGSVPPIPPIPSGDIGGNAGGTTAGTWPTPTAS